MNYATALALAFVLAAGTDEQGLNRFLPPTSSPADSDAVFVQAPEQQPATSAAPALQTSSGATPKPAPRSNEPLKPQSRMLLIRYVDGEFGKLVLSLPGGKKGYRLVVGKPINKQKLADALRLYGTSASQGDTVQITGIEFRSQEIVLQINGGTKKHFNWREHLQVGVGGVNPTPPPQTVSQQVMGANLVVDYGRPLPDMSPDDLKADLAPFFDFSKQHSAAVNWIDTVDPKFRDAIKDHKAIVGMDSEMVLAAMGRPEHKVRERSPEGNETEDWIYGSPPARTTFVTFAGDTVIRVEEFN